MKRRVVDTREYVSMLRELVEEGKEVSLLIAGSSMSPFLIHERDYIYFASPREPLKRGDMVFYQRDSGQFVMHRIYKAAPEGFYIVGDAQQDIEGPVRRDQIFARVYQVQRKGKKIGPGNFWWEFFEHVWIRIVPLRHFAVNLYSFAARWKKEIRARLL